MHKCEVLQPESFVLGCNLINLPLPNVLPPAKFCPRAFHKSKDRPRLPPPAFHQNQQIGTNYIRMLCFMLIPPVSSWTSGFANKDFVACVCYMPSSWDTDEAVMEVHQFLHLILYSRDCWKVIFVRSGFECMHSTNVSTTWLGFMWYMRMGHTEQQRFIVDAMGVGTWLANTQPVGHAKRSSQVRPARQWRARFRAQLQKARICTQLLCTCGKNRQTNQNVSSVGCCPKPHLSYIQDSHTGNTHQVLTPTCFVDGPRVDHTKRLSLIFWLAPWLFKFEMRGMTLQCLLA